MSKLIGKTNLHKRGFTLIELLVTVVIVAVISTIGFVTYSQAQVFARDAKRKQDLKSVASALELYKTRYGHYPNTTPGWSSTGSWWIRDSSGTNIGPDQINFLPQAPTATEFADSTDAAGGGRGYEYKYTPPASCTGTYAGYDGYVLKAKLENRNDQERFCTSSGDTNCVTFTNPCDGSYCVGSGDSAYCATNFSPIRP
jgi:prepilin-type N-terminal cleavage/methylation domain-containing protein